VQAKLGIAQRELRQCADDTNKPGKFDYSRSKTGDVSSDKEKTMSDVITVLDF